MKLSEIAARLGCDLIGDSEVEIRRVAGIAEAGPGDLTFVSNRKYLSQIKTTRASAIILEHDAPPTSLPTLRTRNPYLVFAKSLELFYTPPNQVPGIHPTAVIAEDVELGSNPSVGAYVVIERGCTLGANVTIYPHVTIYPFVCVGNGVVLHAHVSIREHCRIGDRVIVQNGSVIGADGFGFAPQNDGTYYKIVQSGRVVIEDDVEIGANTTVDRAAVGETVIRRGAKLDNLVQVGHGSQVGENAAVAAQVGLAGSSEIGRNVKLAGQVGIAGHLKIGEGAIITAQSGTSHDVDPGAILSGSPAISNALWRRAVTAFAKLPEILKDVRELRLQLDRLRSDFNSKSK